MPLTVPVAALDSLRIAYRKILRAAARLELALPTGDGMSVDQATRRDVITTRVTVSPGNSETGAVESSRATRFSVEVVDVVLELPETGAAAGDWIVVGRVNRVVGEAAEGQNDVYSADPAVVDLFRAAPIVCEHCNVNRYRVRSVICVNVVAGAMKQVGHECATFYVGDAERQIELLAFQELLTVFLAPFGDPDFISEFSSGGAGVGKAFDAEDVVSRAAASVRCFGWIPSKTEDGVSNELATWRNVAHALNNPDAVTRLPVTDEDTARAAAMLKWLAAVKPEGTDEFLPSLQALFAPGWVSSRRLAFAVSIVRAFDRAMADAAKKANPPTAQGPEGRVEVTGVVTKKEWRDNDFGGAWKWIVELPTRARIWSSVPAALDSAKVGDTVTFVATFERSDKDAFFSFGSRPTLPKAKKAKKAKGDKVLDPLAPGGQYVQK